MKKIFKIFILMLLMFPFSTYASTTKEQRDAVLATAEAYYAQGSQLQYDSFRKNLYSTPEDATSKHKVYTVCSGLVYMSYYQALGIKVPDSTDDLLRYARDNQGGPNVIFYYRGLKNVYGENTLGVGSETVTDKEKKAFIKSLMNKNNKYSIRRGDIFVYKGETGHAMLVKSVDYDKGEVVLIEGDGERYNLVKHVDDYETEGAIGYKKFEDRLLPGKTEIALIRVITDGSTFLEMDDDNYTYNTVTYDIKDSARTRMQYPNIDIGKIIKNVDDQAFTSLGRELTYQVKINNKGNVAYNNLEVVENIDPNVEVVDAGGGVVVGSQIKWSVPSITSGNSATILYTVRVKNDKSLLGNIIVSTGRVNGIATSKIETRIGKRLSNERKQQLINKFNEIKKTSNATTSRKFINELYDQAFGLELGISSFKNLDVLSYSDTNRSAGRDVLSVKYTNYLEDVDYKENKKKHLYSNFYGLRIAKDPTQEEKVAQNIVKASLAWNYYPDLELNDRARTLTTEMLETGDVILAYVGRSSTTDTKLGDKGYIFLEDTLYMFKGKNDFETITGDKLRKFLRDLVGENYIILRPTLKTPVSISISNMPSKLVYGQNATDVDLTSGKLLVTYDDGSTKEISMRNDDVIVSGFDNTSTGKKVITLNYKDCLTSFNIDVVSKKMLSISVRKAPSKVEYVVNKEKLDLTGGKLYVHYDDGTKETVSFKSQKVKVTGFSNRKIGKKVLTISYEGFNTSYNVDIVENKVMALSTSPLKSIYLRKESLDLTGGVLEVVQDDGKTSLVGLTNDDVKVTGFDSSKVGVNTVTVEYAGEKLDFYVEVVEKRVTGIVVSTNPTKVNYLLGKEKLDLTGGVITVIYEDGTFDSMSLTNENVSVTGFDNLVVGVNNLLVQYSGVSTMFGVNIIDKKIKDIAVSTKPIKLNYVINKEKLDLTGGILTITYDDGTFDLVSLTNEAVKVSGFNNKEVGTSHLDVEYIGYKTVFDVSIIDEYKTSEGNMSLIIIIVGLVLAVLGLVGILIGHKKKLVDKVNESI